MRLTNKLKQGIDEYFNKVSSEELNEKLVNKYNFKQINIEMEKEFVYLVEARAGDEYESHRELIGVAKTQEKAEEIVQDFNNRFVEGFIKMPMSVDFFDDHICELIDELDGSDTKYRDYLGYTAKQWEDMESIIRITDYGYSLAYITKVELQ